MQRCIGVFLKNSLFVQRSKGIESIRLISTSKSHAKFLSNSPNAYLDKSVLNRYRQLKYDSSKIQATYLWIDGTGENIRLKDRILTKEPDRVEDLPHWQYDGSSTYQALGGNSDTTLIPRAIYRDPFKVGERDVIVVCDTYKPDGNPTESNQRYLMQEAVDKTKVHEPWFGIEQEYTLLDIDGRPFGWPENGEMHKIRKIKQSHSILIKLSICYICRFSRTTRSIL